MYIYHHYIVNPGFYGDYVHGYLPNYNQHTALINGAILLSLFTYEG